MKVSVSSDGVGRLSIHIDEMDGREFDALRCILVDMNKRAWVLTNPAFQEGLDLKHVIRMVTDGELLAE